MATRNDDDGSSGLWKGIQHLIFGDDAEPTLRDEIEDAIDEAEESGPVAGDLSPAERQMLRNLLHFGERTAGDICVRFLVTSWATSFASGGVMHLRSMPRKSGAAMTMSRAKSP